MNLLCTLTVFLVLSLKGTFLAASAAAKQRPTVSRVTVLSENEEGYSRSVLENLKQKFIKRMLTSLSADAMILPP